MADQVTVKATIAETNYITRIETKEFTIPLDEPISVGGSGTAPSPTQYLYSSLAGCVAVTLKMYVQRKGWDVGNITVNILPKEGENGELILVKQISTEHEISEDQKKRMMIIADKCPVSKLLKTGVAQETKM